MNREFNLEKWRYLTELRGIYDKDFRSYPKPRLITKLPKDKYFIVDMHDPDIKVPIVIKHRFDNKIQAAKEIDRKLKGQHWRYWIVRGDKLIGHTVIYIFAFHWRLGLHFTKYDMPPEVMTRQERKNYRTTQRRKNRENEHKTKTDK